MGQLKPILAATVVAGAIAAGLTMASGGPPPESPPPAEPDTVVAHGSGRSRVAEPPRRTDRSVERAVRRARRSAIPRAVANARIEAKELAAAAGLSLGDPVSISRDAGPIGWYEEDSGRFGPGRWCGPIVTWRTVRRDDGTTARTRRTHRGCHKPSSTSVRVTLTFAAR